MSEARREGECMSDTAFALLSMFGTPVFDELACGMYTTLPGGALGTDFSVQDLTQKVKLTLGSGSFHDLMRTWRRAVRLAAQCPCRLPVATRFPRFDMRTFYAAVHRFLWSSTQSQR